MTETRRQYDSVVVGLGKTGTSVVRYLLGQGERLAAVDSRLRPPELEHLQLLYPDLPVYLGEFNKAVLSSARQIVISPGVSIREPAIQAALATGVKVSSDVDIFCQQVKAPLVAVTGSNGKSTVVTLLSERIEESGKKAGLAGNIGTPVLELLTKDEVDFYVLELSSFQLETLKSLNATVALVLNVSPDHMDRYQGFAEYAAAKQRIYAGNGTMILNRDEPLVMGMAEQGRKMISYGLSEPDTNRFGIRMIKGESWLCYGQEGLMPASELRIHGAHNVSNALATLALGSAIDLPVHSMLKVLREFSGLPHRCQWLANINGVDWYNDSKGTNVGASCAAIEGLAENRRLVLIAGGDGKQADFSSLATAVKKHVRAVILIGKDASLIDKVLAVDCRRYFATNMEAAVNTAATVAQVGDAVLLSPACASLDMYRDYQQRGEVFCQAVQALQGDQP